MGLLDWFRGRKKKPKEAEASAIDEEKETLERTGKLRTEIAKSMEEAKRKRKRRRKTESV